MKPPVLSVLNGEDGTIWIRMRTESGERLYRLLDRVGAPLGEVSLPSRTSLLVATRDEVWGIVSDELGMQSVVRLTLQWSRK